MKKEIKILGFICLLIFSPWGFALTADEIALRVDQREDGDQGTANIEMVLIDQQGNQRIRQMQKFEKDQGKDSQSVIFLLRRPMFVTVLF